MQIKIDINKKMYDTVSHYIDYGSAKNVSEAIGQALEELRYLREEADYTETKLKMLDFQNELLHEGQL